MKGSEEYVLILKQKLIFLEFLFVEFNFFTVACM